MAESNRSRTNRPDKVKRKHLHNRERLAGDLANLKKRMGRKKVPGLDPNDRSFVNHKIKRLARRMDAEELDVMMNGDPGDDGDDLEIEKWFRQDEEPKS